MGLQQKMKEILQKEDDLQEIVQLVGKDSLSEDQKCTLEVAKIIREDFLQQNGFTDYDFMCPLAKTIGMMKVIVGFHEAAQKTMAEFSGEHKITWNTIYNSMRDVKKITDMKFELPGSRRSTSRRPSSRCTTTSSAPSGTWQRKSERRGAVRLAGRGAVPTCLGVYQTGWPWCCPHVPGSLSDRLAWK